MHRFGPYPYTWGNLFEGALWEGAWSHVLAWEVSLAGLALIVSAVHDFCLGPRATRRATRLMAEDPETPTASYIGRLMLHASLVILALAVMLMRGGW